MSKKPVDSALIDPIGRREKFLEDNPTPTGPTFMVVGKTVRQRAVEELVSMLLSLKFKHGTEYNAMMTEAQKNADIIFQRQEHKRAEDATKRAELKRGHMAFDFQYPLKFCKPNQTECLMYLKTAPVEEIRQLYEKIVATPEHYGSILDNKVTDAILMLGNELLLRSALQSAEKPSNFVQTAKELLHIGTEKKPETT